MIQKLPVGSIFDFTVENINGESIALSSYKGKSVYYIVNVASKWGLTKANYEGKVALYEQYQEPLVFFFNYVFHGKEENTGILCCIVILSYSNRHNTFSLSTHLSWILWRVSTKQQFRQTRLVICLNRQIINSFFVI